MPNKALFLDRDGVINRDKGYVYRWEDFEFLPGAIEAMRRFSLAGYALIVVSNQSGIARGYYTEAEYQELTAIIRDYLAEHGVDLAGIYHCPHFLEGTIDFLSIECACRKPQPGMLLQAQREHGLNMQQSILVGDKMGDIQAARAAGVGRAYLLASGPRCAEKPPIVDGVFESLADCAESLVPMYDD